MHARVARRIVLLCAVILAAAVGAFCHPPFPDFVQRHHLLSLSPDHIDLEMTLLFHKDEARALRRAIDSNGDGRLTREEIERFRKRSEGWLERLPTRIDDASFEWIVLHPARIDCFDDYVVNSTPVEARLFLFAPMPKEAISGVLRIEDSLFPKANALITWQYKTDKTVTAALRSLDGNDLMNPHTQASARVGGASREMEITFRFDIENTGGDES